MIDTVGTMPRRQLARRLRRLRDVEGYTLEEVATKMETSSSTLSRIEKAAPGHSAGGLASGTSHDAS
jgi:transcriptional regulator with XRE-family HTH domain